MGIRVENVHKNFGSFKALDGVSLAIETGELVALLGPSGSGKTSLLRIIAGLESADRGAIYLNQEEASGRPVKSRNVGFVFQHYALFRHMTVFDNIAFGLRVKNRGQRPDPEIIREKVLKLIDMIHLTGMQDRYPSQLSGGQRQRVALARTLAVDPKMLLLDEPFGALDAKVRKDLRRWLRRLHEDLGITTVFVTHDQEEAMELSDRVVVMNAGRIEQVGTPGEVYHSPANAFVYDFLGNYNAFEGWKFGSDGPHILKPEKSSPSGAENLLLFARPHDMDISLSPQGDEDIPATVIHINPASALISIEMEDRGGRLLQAAITREKFASLQIQKGEEVYLRPRDMRIFPDRRQGRRDGNGSSGT